MTLEAGRRRFGSADGAIALTGVGAPLDRVEGRFKVTGSATYTAEHQITGLTHAALVVSTIARGRIARLDVSAAEAAPGVIGVISHLNTPPMPRMRGLLTTGEGFALQTVMPLEDDIIHHAGQPIAVVVADTLERAQHAAHLVQVEYEVQPPRVEFAPQSNQTYPPQPFFGGIARIAPDYTRGDAARGLADASIRVEHTYTTPIEHHSPIEPHAAIAQMGRQGLPDRVRHNTGRAQHTRSAGRSAGAGLRQGTRDLSVCRRWLRLQSRPLAVHCARRDLCSARRAPGEAGSY